MRATKPHTPPVTWSCVVTTFRAWSTQLQKLRWSLTRFPGHRSLTRFPGHLP